MVSRHVAQLSLQTPSGEVSSLPEITSALFEAAGKTNDGLGASEEQRSQAKEWLSKVESGSFEKAEDVKVSLNSALSPDQA